MNVEYWSNTEQQLGVRVNAHQLEIRKKASDLQSARTMTAFEIKEIEMKEKELQLKERQLELMQQSQSNSERIEKEKANAVGQSKYGEILLIAEGY